MFAHRISNILPLKEFSFFHLWKDQMGLIGHSQLWKKQAKKSPQRWSILYFSLKNKLFAWMETFVSQCNCCYLWGVLENEKLCLKELQLILVHKIWINKWEQTLEFFLQRRDSCKRAGKLEIKSYRIMSVNTKWYRSQIRLIFWALYI